MTDTKAQQHAAWFAQWMNTPAPTGPMDTFPDYIWEDMFRKAGQHHIDLAGHLEYARGDDGGIESIGVMDHSSIERTRKLTPPEHLYRAACPGFENRWSWFETFAMAKLVADDRAGSVRIWTCTADEIFASMSATRTEQGGYKHAWNEWIVRPVNVREINRWRDPFSEVENLPAWERRGVHAVESAGVIGSWFRSTTSKTAPMDRDSGEYWLRQFQNIGEFQAFSSWDAADKATPSCLRVEPAVDLVPPSLLYRGASEGRKDRWSWTAEPETAQAFIDLFCPDDGKIWVAEVETVFGVIHADIKNPEPPLNLEHFSEWIVQPKLNTIREWKSVEVVDAQRATLGALLK
jgi:hypothetical protein